MEHPGWAQEWPQWREEMADMGRARDGPPIETMKVRPRQPAIVAEYYEHCRLSRAKKALVDEKIEDRKNEKGGN